MCDFLEFQHFKIELCSLTRSYSLLHFDYNNINYIKFGKTFQNCSGTRIGDNLLAPGLGIFVVAIEYPSFPI